MGEEAAGVNNSCLGDGEWHCPGASDRGRGLPGVPSQSGVNSSLPRTLAGEIVARPWAWQAV